MKLLFIFLSISLTLFAKTYQHIEYPSLDGLTISAHLYTDNNKSKPFILLFHQASYSKGEYLEIAPKLTQMGFNVMAVDLRSGDMINFIENETSDRALDKNLDTGYISALPDIEASIRYTQKNLSTDKLILWGSSYSSSLVLYIANKTKNISAVLSFAPGEYYKKRGEHFIQEHVKHLTMPVFITSAKEEKANWWDIYQAIPSEKKTFFLPETQGIHGAKALWKSNPSHQLYWDAVIQFLEKQK